MTDGWTEDKAAERKKTQGEEANGDRASKDNVNI